MFCEGFDTLPCGSKSLRCRHEGYVSVSEHIAANAEDADGQTHANSRGDTERLLGDSRVDYRTILTVLDTARENWWCPNLSRLLKLGVFFGALLLGVSVECRLDNRLNGIFEVSGLISHALSLPFYSSEGSIGGAHPYNAYYNQDSAKSPACLIHPIPSYRHGGEFADSYGLLCVWGCWMLGGGLFARGLLRKVLRRRSGGDWALMLSGALFSFIGALIGAIGCLPWNWWRCLHDGQEHTQNQGFHVPITVTQKCLLTSPNYCNTLIAIGRQAMANVLSTDKQIAVISALAEGSSIRSIERITGVHRDTIMRLGVRVGHGCARVLDAEMRNLSCRQLQFDEIWGFIGKKERHCTPDDSLELGDVWTFCAIDADTKIVPSFKCGKRDLATANAFVSDVASRMRNRVQISSDALRAYVDAVEMNFGADVDFAQIIKTYVTDDSHIPERRFSAPEIVITEKKSVSGFPDLRLASTSHVERLNGTTRLHMRAFDSPDLRFQ